MHLPGTAVGNMDSASPGKQHFTLRDSLMEQQCVPADTLDWMDAIPSDLQTRKAAPKGPNSALPQQVLLWLGQSSLQFSFLSDFGTTCADILQLHRELKPELLLKALGEQMDPFLPFRTSPQSS